MRRRNATVGCLLGLLMAYVVFYAVVLHPDRKQIQAVTTTRTVAFSKVKAANTNITVTVDKAAQMQKSPDKTVGSSSLPEDVRLNFVLILIDDLGWKDLACYGNTFHETPNIDRLASQGMKFTQAYASAPVCSPTRGAILTGRYPARTRVTDWIPGYSVGNSKPMRPPEWTKHLPLEEHSLAHALAGAGYVSASIGKWHLGGPTFWPLGQNFSVNIGGCDMGQPPTYWSPYGIPTLPDGPKGEYLTDRLTLEAIKFINESKEQPFFLYLSHYAVHEPIEAKKDLIDKYEEKAKKEKLHPKPNTAYAAMLESVDDGVGAVIATLNKLMLSNRTVVFFASDNGGLIQVTSNAPLRAGKGSVYEGAYRVPFITTFPGVVPPNTISYTPVNSVDLFPTILEMAGIDLGDYKYLDGVSLVPEFLQQAPLKPRSLFWHYPHYHIIGGATPFGAVRQGDMKLIEFYEDNRVELYNLTADIGETKDLSKSMPDKVVSLRDDLGKWRSCVNAQMPDRNQNQENMKDKRKKKRKFGNIPLKK